MTEMVGLTCRVGAHNSRYAHDTRLYPSHVINRMKVGPNPAYQNISLIFGIKLDTFSFKTNPFMLKKDGLKLRPVGFTYHGIVHVRRTLEHFTHFI